MSSVNHVVLVVISGKRIPAARGNKDDEIDKGTTWHDVALVKKHRLLNFVRRRDVTENRFAGWR